MIILGIDPGLARIGFGIIQDLDGELGLVECGTIVTAKTENFGARLQEIRLRLQEVIDRTAPDHCAIEKLFFAKNIKTAMDVAQARGAIAMIVSTCRIPIWEYTPLEVKKSLVGYGRAEKEQINYMVHALLGIKESIPSPDSADAVAVAICHANSYKLKRLME